ncbi:MAG TPA: D-alanyl-D-alanine carboxypeptidase [Lachnospiraceae bacterium]|nr:D-alanyl-D-alanine carboxypeptidase [Lachnospiraceae bacterium]
METEEERQIRRRKRIEEMKREKRRVEFMRRWGIVVASVAVLATAGIGIGSALFSDGEGGRETNQGNDTGTVAIRNVEPGEETGSTNGGRNAPEYESGNPEAPVKRKGNRMANRSVSFPESAETVPVSGPGEGVSVDEEEPDGMLAGKTSSFEAHDSEDTAEFDETIISQYGILIDTEDGTILAQKEAHERMNPASMTKVLTLLVAAEHLTEADLNVTVPITIDITDYCYVNECSVTGYALDEEVPVRDLLYGTILPSGADSSLALAKYVAGSHEAFVEMMNEKVAELGLADSTHFTNCVGLYDEAHYTTAYDMAVIMKAASDNAFCREILSARTYTTTFTEQHPEGLVISNWFLRRIEDKDTHGEILCGKTGFVDQSGSCAASLAVGNDGKEYLCVTGNSTSSWKCIADQVALYQNFIPE